jgi:hypothetical protein
MAKGRSSDASTAGSQSSRSAQLDTQPALGLSICAARGRWFGHGRDAGGKPGADLLDRPLDPQGHFMPVRSLGESCENALCRIESGRQLERTG